MVNVTAGDQMESDTKVR